MRTIQTVYYERGEVVAKNSAIYPNNAVLHCVNHMQLNSYGADTAEVYDVYTGELHAQIKRSKSDTVEIVYKRDPAKYRRAVASIIL